MTQTLGGVPCALGRDRKHPRRWNDEKCYGLRNLYDRAKAPVFGRGPELKTKSTRESLRRDDIRSVRRLGGSRRDITEPRCYASAWYIGYRTTNMRMSRTYR